MQQDNFISQSPKKRVEIVNNLLRKEEYSLQDVADELGLKYSTFTKVMQEDDYVYIKRDNQYYRFVRDEDMITTTEKSDDEFSYLLENLDTLKSIIEDRKAHSDLILDKRIYRTDSKPVTKNFRISEDIHGRFAQLCNDYYPHLKMQDIVSQLLLDFIDRHSD
ncbi:hypothetical protein [Alkalibacillus salilacus]|uniref:DNA-binding MarR family transcriptional regulator n=1 Tax=Alkalibacillus salilacus TaxID=284582 RepID=A0ABT9VFL5_9BACI|nr:hypothetical protein [Alkalibacillus salilacus]MDQ0159746.1 DNA-binding MarR family transcriptional regulator [Alkalibacillus salilacus]